MNQMTDQNVLWLFFLGHRHDVTHINDVISDIRRDGGRSVPRAGRGRGTPTWRRRLLCGLPGPPCRCRLRVRLRLWLRLRSVGSQQHQRPQLEAECRCVEQSWILSSSFFFWGGGIFWNLIVFLSRFIIMFLYTTLCFHASIKHWFLLAYKFCFMPKCALCLLYSDTGIGYIVVLHILCLYPYTLYVDLTDCVCPHTGPICWVQEQIGAGVDPREVLHALRPSLGSIPSHIDDITLWKVRILQFIFPEAFRSKCPAQRSSYSCNVKWMKSYIFPGNICITWRARDNYGFALGADCLLIKWTYSGGTSIVTSLLYSVNWGVVVWCGPPIMVALYSWKPVSRNLSIWVGDDTQWSMIFHSYLVII